MKALKWFIANMIRNRVDAFLAGLGIGAVVGTTLARVLT